MALVTSSITKPGISNSRENCAGSFEMNNIKVLCTVFKSSVPYLIEKEVNGLRLVCKNWKSAIDLLYEEYPHGLLVKKPCQSTDPTGVILKFTSQMENIKSITKNWLGETSPFVGSRLTVRCRDENTQLFWTCLNVMLDKWGAWIRFLHVEYYDVITLFQCLRRLQNLELLYFEQVCTDEEEWIDENFVAADAVPHLPKLRILSVKQDVPNVVIEAIYKRHVSQLSYLALDAVRTLSDSSCAGLKNITVLNCDMTFDGLQLLAKTLPKIKEMATTIVNDRNQEPSMHSIFNCLNAFGDSLETLALGVTATDYAGLRNFILDLKLLTDLTLCNYRGPPDCFIKCYKLRRLALVGQTNLDEWNLNSMVKFYFTDTGLETNIWPIFPLLKTFSMLINRDGTMQNVSFTSVTGLAVNKKSANIK